MPIKSGREGQVMRIGGGSAWRYMLKEYFPSLRKVEIKIDYNITDFDLEKAKSVAQTAPGKLSLNELFLVANEYVPGSDDFNETLQTAATLYPESDIANINAAGSALSRHDLVSAQKYLDKVKDQTLYGEFFNLKGLLQVLEGHYSDAQSAFEKAESMGLTQANLNMIELTKAEQIQAENQEKMQRYEDRKSDVKH